MKLRIFFLTGMRCTKTFVDFNAAKYHFKVKHTSFLSQLPNDVTCKLCGKKSESMLLHSHHMTEFHEIFDVDMPNTESVL